MSPTLQISSASDISRVCPKSRNISQSREYAPSVESMPQVSGTCPMSHENNLSLKNMSHVS